MTAPIAPGRRAARTALGAGAALAVLAGATWCFWPDDGGDAPKPGSAVHAPPARAQAPDARAYAGADLGGPRLEGRLELTPDRRLVPNDALHEVLDYFLLARQGAPTAAALQAYLGRVLPPPALLDALRIARDYQAYMGAHDALLAAHNLHLQDGAAGVSELARLAIWREQRARLRLHMLDREVAQAWYADDDLQLAQAIDELRGSGGGEGAGATPARPIPHWTRQADQARHERYLLDIVRAAVTPFSALRQGRH